MPAAKRIEHEYNGTSRSDSQASASHVLLEPGRDDGPGGIAVRLPPGPPLVWKRPDLLGDGQRAFRQGRFYEGALFTTERLLRRGLHHLVGAPDEYSGVHVAAVRDAAELLLTALRSGQPTDPRALILQPV